jgi:hypothetical protein
MSNDPISAERALALAKFLIQALGEAHAISSRPWDAVTLEQAYDPATPPFGVALIADRLKLATDALAEVVFVPPRNGEQVGGFSKDHAKVELDEHVRRLAAFVVDVRRATDAEAVSRAATNLFVTIGVSVSKLLAEAETTTSRLGWLNKKEVAGASPSAFPR